MMIYNYELYSQSLQDNYYAVFIPGMIHICLEHWVIILYLRFLPLLDKPSFHGFSNLILLCHWSIFVNRFAIHPIFSNLGPGIIPAPPNCPYFR